MSITLTELAARIEKELLINEHDVEPIFLPNMRQIKELASFSLEIISRDQRELMQRGKLRKLKKTQSVFLDTIQFIKNDIKQVPHWTFWHFAGLCVVTCFCYEQLISQKKHETIDLSDQKTWINPGIDEAVITINYITGRLFPKELPNLVHTTSRPDTDIKDVCRFFIKKIDLIRGNKPGTKH